MKSWLIIDGYNLIGRELGFLSASSQAIAVQRRDLIRKLEELAGVLADRVTVVFDGRSTSTDGLELSPAMEVLFSATNQSADSVIEQIVCGAEHPEAITVITSDRGERDTVAAAGAATMACSAFLELLEQKRADLLQQIKGTMRCVPAPTLGQMLPDL